MDFELTVSGFTVFEFTLQQEGVTSFAANSCVLLLPMHGEFAGDFQSKWRVITDVTGICIAQMV